MHRGYSNIQNYPNYQTYTSGTNYPSYQMYTGDTSNPLYSTNYSNVDDNDDRIFFGAPLLAPFLLGGLAGAAVAPAFYRPYPYYPAYPPYPYYPPYPRYY